MTRGRCFTLALLLLAAVAVGRGQSAPPARPWPPEVQVVGDASPALSPADALATFHLPPGYRLELVAAEPLVQDPTVVDFDLDGRLWVVEMTGFVRTLDAPEPNLAPIGRIVVLEDRDGDGRMDTRTVFADGLAVPRAVKVLDQGVLVAEPGILWWMRDTNHDLVADEREVVTREYGRREGSVEGNANGLYWGLDNWIHTSGADIDLRRRHGRFEIRKIPLRGEWGVTQDDAGRIYRNTNESALHVDLVPADYYARHAGLLRTRGLYESLAIDNDALNDVWPVRPNPGTNRAYQLGIDRPDGTLARFTAVCAPLIYRGDRLPADVYGNAFVAEPAANLVSRLVLDDTGASLKAAKAYARGEFIASTDERFRPVFLANAPDGTLYVVDMYRGIIQDKSSTTTYLRDYIVRKQLDAPVGLGRIYRVVHETTRRADPRGLANASPRDLVRALAHPNGWWRETAQRLLVERGLTSVADELADLATTAPDWRTRVHALWTLEGLERLTPDVIVRALDDRAREVRASALRLAEPWLADATRGARVRDAVQRRFDDADWMVRQQLVASVGAMASPDKVGALATLLARYGADPILLDIAMTGIGGSELAILDRLTTEAESPSRVAAVTMIAAMVVRGGAGDEALRLFELLDRAPAGSWARAALLRGGEVALLGASMPGAAARRGGGPALPAPPCPTCPGARGGPGGAYAFPGVREAQAAAAATPGTGRGTTVRLPDAPRALTTLALGSADPLAPRAAAVLGRIEWPGKLFRPAEAAPRPLLPEDAARFARGREVYRNVCQACHQPDGRGQDRLAPPLVGSPLALADATIPLRILLNGKEGPTGLMPPLGASMTDDDLASVLTYIRREWNQTADPVSPPDVAAARAGIGARSRPWTDDELQRLVTPASGR